MRMTLDGALVRKLIKARGGVPAFLERWSSANAHFHEDLDRATVYRWMKGETLPKNSTSLLRLASILDVDPFALFLVPVGEVVAMAEEILRMVQFSRAELSPLQFAHDFFGRQKSWPPEHIAHTHYRRPWHVEEFSHHPRDGANYYGSVTIHHTPAVLRGAPQILHFAFCQPGAFQARWLQYGLVRVHETSVALHHINGQTDYVDLSEPGEPFAVETWFGPGPALFRIASLHDFTYRMTASGGAHGKAVRFLG